MVHEFMKIQRGLQTSEVEWVPLAQQTQCQLVEGQNMDIDQGKALFQAQQAFQVIAQRFRRNDDCQWSKRLARFQPAEIGDKGGFKIWMERSCDNAKHQPQKEC
jgi:hypothetical protein